MRTFVAVEINNNDILKKIHSLQKSVHFKAKPVRIDQIHFTLQFLGEIDGEKCKKVQDVLNTITFSQFNLSLKGVGGFPNLKNPRVIWIGIDKKGAEKLAEITREIETRLTPLGFKKDKKFKPHLTVLRIKHKNNDISLWMKEYKTSEFGIQIVSKIKFKKSVLSPKGPEYSDLMEMKGNEK